MRLSCANYVCGFHWARYRSSSITEQRDAKLDADLLPSFRSHPWVILATVAIS